MRYSSWPQTGDMMFVGNLRGHRNLQATGIYTRFAPTRPAEDFLDLTAYLSEHSIVRAERLGIGAMTGRIHQRMMPPWSSWGFCYSATFHPTFGWSTESQPGTQLQKRSNPMSEMGRRIFSWVVLPLVLLAWSACGPVAKEQAQLVTPEPVPLLRAHAHNDFQHSRPLHDALHRGFTSVEADIYLVDGELLVAHYRVDVQPDRTLAALYLTPLRERIHQHGGQVYRGGPQFWLLIDIKSGAEVTYAALRKELQQYADILDTYGPAGGQQGPVAVIISGNRPRETMENEDFRYAAYDGRLEDLGSDAPADFIPLISDKWTVFFTWTGAGPMPADEREQLASIVAQAHGGGRRVRFWATPDNPGAARDSIWHALLAAGVDLINTDDLEGLQRFLLDNNLNSPNE